MRKKKKPAVRIKEKEEREEEEKKEPVIKKIKIIDKEKFKKKLLFGVILGLVISIILLIFSSWILAVISFFAVIFLTFLYDYLKKSLDELKRIKKMEDVFPDFLQLMASNLRAGITIDKAILLSSRKEFSPLDEEILKTGKDITTGKSIETALLDMAKRIKSDKIKKTILLVISGIRAGGNLAVLLEETSVNMRERDFVEKRAASNVLMYVIFIFIAVSVGAPALFSLSGILVETLTNLLGNLPVVNAPQGMLFTLSSVNVSVTFIKYFSIVFIIVIDVLASLILGLVSKGEEREGLKFLIPLLAISLSIFFLIRIFLSNFVSGLFG